MILKLYLGGLNKLYILKYIHIYLMSGINLLFILSHIHSLNINMTHESMRFNNEIKQISFLDIFHLFMNIM